MRYNIGTKFMPQTKKPDYKNWMPKRYLVIIAVIATLLLTSSVLVGLFCFRHHFFWLRITCSLLLFLFGSVFVFFFFLGLHWYKAFSYDGNRQMAKEIINGLSEYCKGKSGKILDVGCGSGALTIALAHKNPEATVYGIDRWGMEYIDVTRKLCEDNAKAEEVENAFFLYGDVKKLDFPDGYFDAVVSNYCYSNVFVSDRQQLIIESLRTLKKGGTFAIHDIMDWMHFGDMDFFIQRLKMMGFEEVHLVDTTKGLFMSETESFFLSLSGSYLLYGKK